MVDPRLIEDTRKWRAHFMDRSADRNLIALFDRLCAALEARAPEGWDWLKSAEPTVSKTGSDVVLSFASGTDAAQALGIICEAAASPRDVVPTDLVERANAWASELEYWAADIRRNGGSEAREIGAADREYKARILRDLVSSLAALPAPDAAPAQEGMVEGLVERLEARVETLERMDREAATYVESEICLRTSFTGSEPYVGWKGLGRAMVEAFDERDNFRAALEKIAEAKACDAPHHCRYCDSDAPHPPSWEAQIARDALTGDGAQK